MNGLARLAALAAMGVLCAMAAAHAADPDAVTIRYAEPLERLVISADTPGTLAKPGAVDPARMSFDAFGRRFDLALEPNHRLLSDAARASLTGSARIYRGEIPGEPGSWARIVVADGVPRGLVAVGRDLYAIEPAAQGGARMYRLDDMEVPPGSASCATEAPDGTGTTLYGKIAGELGQAAAAKPGAVSRISIGVLGDYALYQQEGDAAEPALLARLNNVDGIFSEQLGVEIYVESLHVFKRPAADPFSDTDRPSRLLDDLADFRKRSSWQLKYGLTHLFTGRDLEGRTVGIAYNGSLCRPEYGVGLTQYGRNLTFDSLVAAHEIGHNFGAPHDGETGSACAAETGAFLMSASINGSDRFSNCSIAQIQPHIAKASCLAPLPTVDAALALPNPVPVVTLGSSAKVPIDVSNGGTAAAANVTVEITLPVNAGLESVTAANGTCTDGAGMVSCTFDELPAGSARRITLELTGADVGSGELVATAFADADVDPANDSLAAEFRVEPAPPSGTPSPATAPPASSGSGGGGASEPVWLLLLAFGAAWLTQRRTRPS